MQLTEAGDGERENWMKMEKKKGKEKNIKYYEMQFLCNSLI